MRCYKNGGPSIAIRKTKGGQEQLGQRVVTRNTKVEAYEAAMEVIGQLEAGQLEGSVAAALASRLS